MAVYGIDFGTCYSCVAMAEDDGSITIVPSSTAQNSIPSIVMFNTRKDGKPIVGLTAKRALEHPNPQNVVAFIKTEMHEETTKKRYKITEEEKGKIEAAKEALKEALKGEDIEAIKAKQEELQKEVYAVSEKIYKAAAEAQGAGAEGAGAEGANGGDNVYEADFTDVDDNNKN